MNFGSNIYHLKLLKSYSWSDLTVLVGLDRLWWGQATSRTWLLRFRPTFKYHCKLKPMSENYHFHYSAVQSTNFPFSICFFLSQREAPVQWYSTASSSRRLRPSTTMCRTYSRASSDRSAWGKTARRRTHGAWPTAGVERASAKRPRGSWAAWSHARTRKWLSGRSQSPVMTLQFSEKQTGQTDILFFGLWRPDAVCVLTLTLKD